MKLLVHEIFYSIQCEGPFTGVPAVFIRLFGCNLSCSFCDTPQEPSDCHKITVDEVIATVNALSRFPLVVLTGGEPLRQDIEGLCRALISNGKRVQIETNGMLNFPFAFKNPAAIVVCSPKNRRVHKQILENAIAFKYTLDVKEGLLNDGLPPAVSRPAEASKVMVGARDNDNFKENIELAVAISKQYGYALNVQVHKLLEIK